MTTNVMLTIDTIDIELIFYQVSVLSFDDDSSTNWPVTSSAPAATRLK